MPYYLVLAAMNGIAAYYMWQKAEPVTFFRARLPGVVVSFTNALLWTIVAIGVRNPGVACGRGKPQLDAAISSRRFATL